jgi:broad specificity phosphatase PhoE
VTGARRAAWTVAFAVVVALLAAPVAASTEAAWAALRAGGHVLIVRHAQTEPGVGDPPNFARGDCATQRNLSERGREQARAMGQRVREAGVAIGPVLSSAWCRCLDTAQLAFGTAEAYAPLDSFFGARTGEPAQTAALRERIRSFAGPGTLALVTHQVNISALTGEHPAMGEAFVLAPGGPAGFRLVGRIAF